MWGLDAAGPAVFPALLAPMLRTATERAVAAVAVVLGLGLLPVLPAEVPVLVAALTAQQAFAEGRVLELDAKALGLAAAAVALLMRAPFLVVIGAAVAVTAGARALMG